MLLEKINENSLIGKTILVGMTFYNKNDEFVEQKQIFGEIVAFNQNTISIMPRNGEVFFIPNDKSAIDIAKPGKYRLISTGETIENPNYLSTWNITLSDKKE